MISFFQSKVAQYWGISQLMSLKRSAESETLASDSEPILLFSNSTSSLSPLFIFVLRLCSSGNAKED